MRNQPRIEGIDALRGLAALSVVLYHYTAWYDSDYGPHHTAPGLGLAFVYGQFGVELFFIISGFVIYMTLENTNHIYDFAVSRIARLYPAFLACLTVTLVTAYLLDFEPARANLARIAGATTCRTRDDRWVILDTRIRVVVLSVGQHCRPGISSAQARVTLPLLVSNRCRGACAWPERSAGAAADFVLRGVRAIVHPWDHAFPDLGRQSILAYL
jgi:hypothetical protein